MKKWKKRLFVWTAVIFATFCLICSVQANPLQPYDRSQAVAPEELEKKNRAAEVGSSSDTRDFDNPQDSEKSKAWEKMNGICYNGSGEVIPGAITRGIDVSEWQGEINWNSV